MYTRKNDIIFHEITNVLGDAAADFDIDAIADELILVDCSGVDPIFTIDESKDFWAVVQAHEI